jgi:hypothetical protein
MSFDYELILISCTSTENDMGDAIDAENPTPILCDVQSVSRSEHYAAAAHNLKPEIVFIVNQYDYNGEKEVEFEGNRFIVIREYKPKKSKGLADFESIELVCKGAT